MLTIIEDKPKLVLGAEKWQAAPFRFLDNLQVFEDSISPVPIYTRVAGIANIAADTRINLGVTLPAEWEIELVTRPKLGSFYICQSREADSRITGVSGSQTGSKINTSCFGVQIDSAIARELNNRYFIRATARAGTLTLYVKNLTTNIEDTKTGRYTIDSLPQAPLCIFGNTKSNFIDADTVLEYAKITLGNTLAFNLLPVLDTNNAACFYNKITRQFIYPEVGAVTAILQ